MSWPPPSKQSAFWVQWLLSASDEEIERYQWRIVRATAVWAGVWVGMTVFAVGLITNFGS